jgi:hypothetical protein
MAKALTAEPAALRLFHEPQGAEKSASCGFDNPERRN